MVNRLLFLLAFLPFTSCFNNTTNTEEDYFEYDNLEYYYKNIDEDELYNLTVNSDSLKISLKQKELNLNIITRRYPENVNHKSFLKELIDYNYLKVKIKEKDFDFINEIFKENNCEGGVVMACAPIYRDVLVFYKENKVVGIAKICFGCRQSYIVGTTKNTENFGHCGDFEKLKSLLEDYLK